MLALVSAVVVVVARRCGCGGCVNSVCVCMCVRVCQLFECCVRVCLTAAVRESASYKTRLYLTACVCVLLLFISSAVRVDPVPVVSSRVCGCVRMCECRRRTAVRAPSL